MPTEYLTKEGFKKLEDELCLRKAATRREIAERIEEAKELGDLSENAEYASAKDEFAFNEGRIAELEEIVKNSVIIHHHANHQAVSIGSKVRVKDGGAEREYVIVGSTEANPLEGRISNESPFGRAFLGKSVGDEVEVRAPKGVIKVKITNID